MIDPLVSIIMLSYNRMQDVLESLAEIANIEYPNLEVVVVDNASTDGTVEAVTERSKEWKNAAGESLRIHLLSLPKNIGVAAYNRGIAHSSGEYLVIIDDDSYPHSQAIRRMVDVFQVNPQLGVVAFDVRHEDSKASVPVPSPDNWMGGPMKPIEQPYLMSFNGAGCGVRRSVLPVHGLYAENFFLYNNELDAAYRIWDQGYEIQFFKEIVAYHRQSLTNRTSKRAPFFYVRNAFWIAWTHLPLTHMLRVTGLLLFYCGVYTIEQKTDVYLQAAMQAFRGMKDIFSKRKPVSDRVAMQLRVPYPVFFTFYR